MSLASYLSFSSLYEIEKQQQQQQKQQQVQYHLDTTSVNPVCISRRDSNSSNSSSSSTRPSTTATATSSITNTSVYTSHSTRLHAASRRYSTEDGTLPLPTSTHTCAQQDLSLRRYTRR